MKIYFACSITGGREFEPVYQAIVNALEEDGHEIPTSHLASSEVVHWEKIITPEEVYARDVDWITSAEALVAEVSTPSHGVGYEIAYALGLGKRVLCVHHADRSISKMITGNPDPNLRVYAYTSFDQVLIEIRRFLNKE
jgi:nucleoside 2-deoxyribosyltransferase